MLASSQVFRPRAARGTGGVLLALILGSSALAHPPSGKLRPLSPEARALLETAKKTRSEADLLAARKALAKEGRYSCCITGGCTECLIEGVCACGPNLLAKDGVCQECVAGWKVGVGKFEGIDPKEIKLEKMGGMQRRGALGPWSMNREGSGTSWLPESSPMYGTMGQRGAWQVMQMGMATGAFASTGGKRGESQVFGATQYMLQVQKTDEKSRTLGLRTMLSLDPLTNGKKGYPSLFQTGETANNQPLKDRQHPHDLFIELAATYSAPLGGNRRGFLYLAPAGEPALGPAAFQHRPSAWDNPTAPISHHWLDGTHITYGVVTGGAALGEKWKLEGSAFNGREPNENRYNIDPIRLNSYSGRVTHNPGKDLSFQVSYGQIKSPESLEPGVDVHRLTLSALHNRVFASGDNLASMLALGESLKSGGRPKTRAILTETAYTHGAQSYFVRLDSTQKDELVGIPAGVYRVQKLSLGGSQGGLGASLDFYSYPSALKPFYGNAPVSVTLFYRWRLGQKM